MCCTRSHPGRKWRWQEDTGRYVSLLAGNLHLPLVFSWLNFACLQWHCTRIQLNLYGAVSNGLFPWFDLPASSFLFPLTERCGRFRLWEALTEIMQNVKGSEKAKVEQWLWRETSLSLDGLYKNCHRCADCCPASLLFSHVILRYIGIKLSTIRFSSSDAYFPMQLVLSKKQRRCSSRL